jgi:hypothetical protein
MIAANVSRAESFCLLGLNSDNDLRIVFSLNFRRQDRNAAFVKRTLPPNKEHKAERALDLVLPPPLQLRRKTHPTRPATRAAHGDEDALLLLVVEVGALQHGGGL